MNDRSAQTLLGAARKRWRSFLPVWLFPIFFFYGGEFSDRVGHPVLFFLFVAMPLFFWTYGRASRVWTSREIRFGHAALLGVVAPFVVWAIVVFLHLVIVNFLEL